MANFLQTLPGPLSLYQFAAFLLLGIGLLGLSRRRTLVGMLIAVELMLSGAGLSIAASASLTPANTVLGHAATLLVMGLAAAEATLLLAIMIVVYRRFGSIRTDDLTTLQD
ncbi:NADH-quinone oxidoreductase subunit NuoK [Desulfosarcina sp. OttesenSCG-928-G10]|nr:NADH-quinone oxidoreductase subunit NuoK [Desulfosarcina sp. OttesenSCG-928-G10]